MNQKKFSIKLSIVITVTSLLCSQNLLAQTTINDDCSGVINLAPGASCIIIARTLNNATLFFY